MSEFSGRAALITIGSWLGDIETTSFPQISTGITFVETLPPKVKALTQTKKLPDEDVSTTMSV